MKPLFARLEYWEDTEPREAALQMDIDRALLETTTLPVLRTYKWARPCVTIGYFGSETEAAALYPKLPITRRWTGGGTVLHGRDAPYSLIVPRPEPFASLKAPDSYRTLHGILAAVLKSEFPDVCSAVESAPKKSSDCFQNPVTDDLLSKGCKVAGAGQRRTRHGLLHQGSLQIGSDRFTQAIEFGRSLAVEVGLFSRIETTLACAQRMRVGMTSK